MEKKTLKLTNKRILRNTVSKCNGELKLSESTVTYWGSLKSGVPQHVVVEYHSIEFRDSQH